MMIQLESVKKHYQTASGEVRALDDLSLEIAAGEFVAIRGPSGCGKSTLLSLIGGLATPTSGKVLVLDREVSSMSPAERAQFRADNVGFVFQLFHLLPYLTVRENILLSARPANQADDEARADELISKFDLSMRHAHLPGQLSAGERQRTAMARALLTGPALLLADEPTGNLDPVNADAVLDLISAFNEEGGTVLLVTHDERAAARAKRIIQLEAGKLQTESVA